MQKPKTGVKVMSRHLDTMLAGSASVCYFCLIAGRQEVMDLRFLHLRVYVCVCVCLCVMGSGAQASFQHPAIRVLL